MNKDLVEFGYDARRRSRRFSDGKSTSQPSAVPNREPTLTRWSKLAGENSLEENFRLAPAADQLPE
jgi:hypothetical protein